MIFNIFLGDLNRTGGVPALFSKGVNSQTNIVFDFYMTFFVKI